MYLQTLKPYRKPGSIHNEIDNLLHEFFGGPIHTGPLVGEWLPAADITETEDRVFVKAELPGIEEKDIDLSICGNVLTIRGEKKHLKEEKDENHYLGDRYYGSFRRTFQLPADIDPDRAEATYRKGILKISVPRVEEAKRKRIEININ
ncbi:MAG: Hsp20/alpha crystallin family protein [Desulfobacterales bacterium]|jgi:HSP20 family protein